MVAIQFTNRFFGFQPKVRECGQFLQNLRPEPLGVFAAGVEVPCKLVEVAAHLAALGRQGSKRRQCILAALRHHDGVLDVHAVQDAADELGLGEVEFFAGVCDPQFFFCGHPDFDDAVANFSSYLIPNATNNLGTTTESIDKAVDEWLVPICLMNIHVGDSLVKYFGDYEIAEKAYAVVANFTGMEITETGRQVMDLAKNRLIPIREEKAKKELEEKEAIAAATKRRTEEYWACHEEERKQLEAQMESLLENRKHLNSQVEALRKEMDNVPSIAVRDEKQKVMGDLKEQLKSLGFFKGKEKKSIQARIDELKHEMEQLTASIESEKAPLQQKISELMGEVRKLDEQVGTITIELTKER